MSASRSAALVRATGLSMSARRELVRRVRVWVRGHVVAGAHHGAGQQPVADLEAGQPVAAPVAGGAEADGDRPPLRYAEVAGLDVHGAGVAEVVEGVAEVGEPGEPGGVAGVEGDSGDGW